jgi:hypothetical protein
VTLLKAKIQDTPSPLGSATGTSFSYHQALAQQRLDADQIEGELCLCEKASWMLCAFVRMGCA